MAAIITRQTAGSGATVKNLPLSNVEVDTNFINLNSDKLETADAVSTNTINKVVRRDGSGGFSSGSISIDGTLGVGTAAAGTTGEIRAAGNIVSNYSDQRLKENIQLIPSPLDKVERLRGVTFTPNQLAETFGYPKKQEVGVIAQDVLAVLPEAIKPAPFDVLVVDGREISKSGENYLTVQYEKIVPLLIESIKELNRQVKELKGEK